MNSAARGRKTIFITGAASGIGRAGAKLFASKGWYVGAATDADIAGLASLERELGPDNVFTRKLDVRDHLDSEAALRAFGEATDGRLDLMWNNAGVNASGWFEDVPVETARRVIDVNLMGALNGARAALPLLKAATNALLFTTSSAAAIYGRPGIAVYAASKFAVKGLTEALSVEFARHGVRVADVLPGIVDTPMISRSPRHPEPEARPTHAAVAASVAKTGPLRLITAESVAETAWAAYNDTSGRLHWYLPRELRRLELMKGLAPEYVRARIMRGMAGRLRKPEK